MSTHHWSLVAFSENLQTRAARRKASIRVYEPFIDDIIKYNESIDYALMMVRLKGSENFSEESALRKNKQVVKSWVDE